METFTPHFCEECGTLDFTTPVSEDSRSLTGQIQDLGKIRGG